MAPFANNREIPPREMEEDKDDNGKRFLNGELNPLSPEVIASQATINIGTIGHVAHGKSTLVKAIFGVQTVRFKNELKNNITIKLGYANAKIYKCEDENCPRPMCYKACGSGIKDAPFCHALGYKHARMRLVRHVSFVDCPGHDSLMATMLNGAAIMDGALLLIAANEPFPQPQTIEHLVAIDYMRLEDVIVVQNKIDLIKKVDAIKQNQEIHKFLQNTTAQGAPVVPISAQMGCNIDVICEYLVNKIPIPVRDFDSPATLRLVRSFDVNKPGAGPEQLQGGVVGGSILKGVLKPNDIVEIRPGRTLNDENGDLKCYPIHTRIVSLFAEGNKLKFAVPGGLIGVGTTMDPTLSRADRLKGHMLGIPGSLPDVYSLLEVKVHLLLRVVGMKAIGTDEQEATTIPKIVKGENLIVTISSMSTKAAAIAVNKNRAKLHLVRAACASTGDKVALSREVKNSWRLIGWGEILGGNTLEIKNIYQGEGTPPLK